MNNRKSLLRIGVVALALVVMAGSAYAALMTSRINYLTFSGTVALPGVVLPAGTYTFELAPPSGGLDIVRVSSRDGRRTFFMGFTQTALRPAGLGQNDLVTFGESASGRPAPIDTWFPVGAETGRRFIYR